MTACSAASTARTLLTNAAVQSSITMPANQQEQSPLFGLPAELRNRIYEIVSIVHTSNAEPALFSTCRKIREEGLELFYTTHTFSFKAAKSFSGPWPAERYHHFLTCLGASKAIMIEHLAFHIRCQKALERDTSGEMTHVAVTLDARTPRILDARFSRGNVAKEHVAALNEARDGLNAVWQGHPSKVGILRTLPALVPRKIRIEEADEDDERSSLLGMPA